MNDAPCLVFVTSVAGAAMVIAALFDLSPLQALVAAVIAVAAVTSTVLRQFGQDSEDR